MNLKKTIPLLTTIISFFVVNFYGIEYKELLSKLQQQDEKIEKLKVKYRQIINFLDLKEVYELKAEFIYLKPDKLKVNVYEPFQQIIVADSSIILVK
ncbi:MAG: hypothetical protein NZ839_04555, partial [Endomicrobia bacterium]|nr:hypothetical protein [Endomicrobiia bacterium]